MPEIIMVAAMAKNRVIGKDNAMPWHLPADLKHFKQVTMAKPIIMGRKTFASLGRPLPGRQNIIITRNADFVADGCDVVSSIDAALVKAGDVPAVMIIGGAEIYRQFLPLATCLHLTFIDLETEGDTYFPEYSEDEWRVKNRQQGELDDKNRIAHEFVELIRVD